MEVSGVGATSVTGHTIAQRRTEASQIDVSRRTLENEWPNANDNRRFGGRGRHGLSVLRKEIQLLLATSFQFSRPKLPDAYKDNAGPPVPGDIAAETLGAAKEITARSPLQASDTLVDIREKVDGAAAEVRNSVAEETQDDVSLAIDLVNEGIDDLEKDAARNVESSATVLSAETLTKQRSMIRIRTQEGDTIRLSLRNVERMSVEDVAFSNNDSTFTSTDIQMSSRSRMVLRVHGDLNEAEMAAIKSVFEQAEAIAEEFYGGDLSAAFDNAANLQYDTEQLSRISMRFQERQTSNIAYAEVTTRQADVPANPAPVPAGPAEPVAQVAEPNTSPDEAPVTETTTPDAAPEESPPEPVLPLNDAIAGFFDLLSRFLGSLNEGFVLDSRSDSFRFFYSQSFNLQILKTIIQVGAPEESDRSAETASAIIDSVSE